MKAQRNILGSHRFVVPLAAALLLVLPACVSSRLATVASSHGELSGARLRLPRRPVAPGERVAGQVVIWVADQWHTYGDPAGDFGMPPYLSFELPEGWQVEVGELPPTKILTEEAGVSYVYKRRVAIPFVLVSPAVASPGPIIVKLNVQWLICRDVCLPESAILEGKLEWKLAGGQATR